MIGDFIMEIGRITTGKYYARCEVPRKDKRHTAKNFASRMENRQDKDIMSQADIFSVGNQENPPANTVMEAYLISSANRRLEPSSIKNIETDRYTIGEKEGGYLRIYDKERKEGFNWKLNENQIQTDKETGKKFLINDWGSGFFNMVAVDDELEKGIKEALGVDELETKELAGFTVHRDESTGVHYITADGYESRGGLIVFDEQANQKLNSLAQVYLDKYPNLVKSFNEAWFYATFEVRGLAKRSPNEIMMISPNSISFKGKNGENGWTGIFDPGNWEAIKEQFDNGSDNMGTKEWKYWENLLKRKNIDCSLIIPDERA